ncbi:hypothetical protein EMCRGX_G018335 [Ephydatia muelleri]
MDAKDSRENEDLSNQSRRSVVRRGSRGLRRRRAGRRGAYKHIISTQGREGRKEDHLSIPWSATIFAAVDKVAMAILMKPTMPVAILMKPTVPVAILMKPTVPVAILMKPTVPMAILMKPTVPMAILMKPTVPVAILMKPTVPMAILMKPTVPMAILMKPTVPVAILMKPTVPVAILMKPTVPVAILMKPTVPVAILMKPTVPMAILMKPTVPVAILMKPTVPVAILMKPTVPMAILMKPTVPMAILMKPTVPMAILMKPTVPVAILMKPTVPVAILMKPTVPVAILMKPTVPVAILMKPTVPMAILMKPTVPVAILMKPTVPVAILMKPTVPMAILMKPTVPVAILMKPTNCGTSQSCESKSLLYMYKGESTHLNLDRDESARCEVEPVIPKRPIPCSSVRKEELSSTSLGWAQPPEQSMQRGNSRVCQASVQRCEGLRSEREGLQVQCIARQAEERRRGPEEERNGLLEQSKDFHSQLQKASEDHTSQAEFAAQQLTVYKCELEKERAQRERLLKENVRLTSEKNALQQEKLQLERRLEEETNRWREKYEQLIIETETTKETASRKIKQLESQLYSSQEASRGMAELEGTLSEQNTRLQEYYAHMEEQNNTIRALESRVASLEGELKRANEEKNQLKVEIEEYKGSLIEYAEQCESYHRDLVLKDAEIKEAQKQCAESNRRLQQTDGELALGKTKLEEEREKLQVQCTTHHGLETRYRCAQTQIKVLEEEKARLLQQKEELQKVSEPLQSRLEIMTEQLKVNESDLAKEQAQFVDSLLFEANTQKQSLQQEINSLTAKLQESQEAMRRMAGEEAMRKMAGEEAMRRMAGEEAMRKMAGEEAMRRMAGELEMASKHAEELRSRISSLEAELKRCYKHIEDQKKTIEEVRMKNEMELMNRRIAVLERDKELEASGVPNHFRRSLSHSGPQAYIAPHPACLFHTAPHSMAPEGEGVVINPCPICGQGDFKSAEDLVLHSAKLKLEKNALLENNPKKLILITEIGVAYSEQNMATPADDMTQLEDALKTQLKDSRENEDLPEDRDQCRRRTGKQRSEEEDEEEQEGTEEEEEGGRVLTNREVVRTTGEANTNSEDTQGQDRGALEGEWEACEGESTQLDRDTAISSEKELVTEREAHLQQIISCLVGSRKQEQALREKQYSELQETIRMSQAVVSVLQQTTCCSENADDRQVSVCHSCLYRAMLAQNLPYKVVLHNLIHCCMCRLVDLREQMTKLVHLHEILEKALFGLSSENERLQVQLETTCGVAQTQIKLLEEERRGLEKASEEHKSQLKIMAERLKEYESDFEKERAQREKLLAEYDTLKAKNILLQQESSTVVALQQRCDDLMSEKEELLVQCMAQRGQIKVLEEERNGLLEERSNFCSQLQKASEDHRILAEQLKVYKSDFEKERAQQEKLLAENKVLKSEKNSLEQEKDSVVARLQHISHQFKLLEEEKCGLEKERNGLLEQSKDFRSQILKASEDHTSQAEIMAEQLTVYKSDFENERTQREKLLAEYDTLKSEKNSLQQEKNASSDEKEKLQAKLKLLEEERRGLEKERNGLLEESKDFRSQLQKASEDHTSQAEIMAEQLTVYKSDFENECTQRESF